MGETGPHPSLPDDLTEDGFLGGRLRLRQPKRGHRAGHDAVLLAAATPAQPGQRVVEFGAGVGAVGLAVATRVGGLDLVLIEIDSVLAELARDNVALNNLAARVAVLDVAARPDAFASVGLSPDSADMVLMNPPFNIASRFRSSPDKQDAHIATDDMLGQWVHAARRVLKPGGMLTLIWRADGLADVLAALSRGFGSIAIIPVHSAPASPAIRIIVRATKGGRAPLELFPALLLNDEAGNPAPEARAILEGQSILPLAQTSGARNVPR
jgi:tRNA1(Val) A37 N6-methylase TrmN6